MNATDSAPMPPVVPSAEAVTPGAKADGCLTAAQIIEAQEEWQAAQREELRLATMAAGGRV